MNKKLLTDILSDPTRTSAERQLAKEALLDSQPDIVHRFLTACEKTHIKETNETEYWKFVTDQDLAHARPEEYTALLSSFSEWVLPSAQALSCLGFSEPEYWLLIADSTKSYAVKAHALERFRTTQGKQNEAKS
jgi:hypothetical protein